MIFYNFFLIHISKSYRWFLRRMIIPCNLSLGRYWILYCETLALLPLASQLYPTNMVVRHSYCYQNQLLGDLKIHHLSACNRKRSFQDQPFRLRLFWSGLWKECTVYTIRNSCNGYILGWFYIYEYIFRIDLPLTCAIANFTNFNVSLLVIMILAFDILSCLESSVAV